MEEPEEPHEMKLTLGSKRTTRTRTILFKRKAPNDMKNEDLNVKSWIITDRQLLIARPARHSVAT
jgi:hypothetical protein